MHPVRDQPISGHIFRVDRKRGPQWYAKYRLPDGRQVQKPIGPAWTERGRPAAGYFTKRTAETALREVLDQARRGTLPGMIRTGATVDDACDEYLRWIEHDRGRKRSTVGDYRSTLDNHVRPVFGDRPLESLTTAELDRWIAELRDAGKSSRRTLQKVVVIFHGVMERPRKQYGLAV